MPSSILKVFIRLLKQKLERVRCKTKSFITAVFTKSKIKFIAINEEIELTQIK